jgi:Holliday junction resolvasome RuvABC endonuclease subunit
LHLIAFDPGMSGGWAVIRDGVLTDLGRMPVTSGSKNGKTSNSVSPALVAQLVRDQFPLDCAYVEAVTSRPAQGVASTFKFGTAYGVLLGVLAMAGVPVRTVTPQKWRAGVGIVRSSDLKAGSQARALQVFPQHTKLFSIKANEGVWEAALIAHYGLTLERTNP